MYFCSLTYFHQSGDTALMQAANNGHAKVTKLLLEAGADVDAKSNVSKTIFIFSYLCVCVEGRRLFYHHTEWYDNVIIMNNFTIIFIIVFVFVLIIITSVLLFYLINMMISIVNIFLFMIFMKVFFFLFFSVIIFSFSHTVTFSLFLS